jgi:hypothetical protein
MIELESLPLPHDWRVFKTRGKHTLEETECIKALFANDPRLEDLGVSFWIEIYRGQRKKRKKSGFQVREATVTRSGIIQP